MNYKEAVIVPLEVFNKCNFNPQEKELPPQKTGDILNDKTLPPDVKVKLYNQKKKLTKRPLPEPQLVQIKKEVEVEAPSEDIILNQFPLRTKPVANLILKYSTISLIRTPFIRKSGLTELLLCLPYFGFVVYRVRWAIIGDFNQIFIFTYLEIMKASTHIYLTQFLDLPPFV